MMMNKNKLRLPGLRLNWDKYNKIQNNFGFLLSKEMV